MDSASATLEAAGDALTSGMDTTLSIHDNVFRVGEAVVAIPKIARAQAGIYTPPQPSYQIILIILAIPALIFALPLGIIMLAIAAFRHWRWLKKCASAPKCIELYCQNGNLILAISYADREFANRVLDAIEASMCSKPIDLKLVLPSNAKVHMGEARSASDDMSGLLRKGGKR